MPHFEVVLVAARSSVGKTVVKELKESTHQEGEAKVSNNVNNSHAHVHAQSTGQQCVIASNQ